MKKKYVIKACYWLSFALAVIFIIKNILDYRQYDSMLNSAPFYLWIVVNALYFLLPALILLVVAVVIKKR